MGRKLLQYKHIPFFIASFNNLVSFLFVCLCSLLMSTLLSYFVIALIRNFISTLISGSVTLVFRGTLKRLCSITVFQNTPHIRRIKGVLLNRS